MYRGTTPTLTFQTDIDLSDAKVIYITIKQGLRRVLEFTNDGRIAITPTSLTVTLTQEETLLLRDEQAEVNMQIRTKFADGTALASNIMSAPVSKILKDGEI